MSLNATQQAQLATLLRSASKKDLEGTRIAPVKLSKPEIGRIEVMLAMHGTVIVCREKHLADRKRACRMYTKQTYLGLVERIKARRSNGHAKLTPITTRKRIKLV